MRMVLLSIATPLVFFYVGQFASLYTIDVHGEFHVYRLSIVRRITCAHPNVDVFLGAASIVHIAVVYRPLAIRHYRPPIRNLSLLLAKSRFRLSIGVPHFIRIVCQTPDA